MEERKVGRSLTNNHILNAEGLSKAQFKKAFTDMMKSKGYTKAAEDDAAVSYSLVFTNYRKWVTIIGEDINAAELAKSLGLQVLSVELVDSDFAEVVLHGADGSADTLMLGEPYFDEYPELNPDAWQDVLGENGWSKVGEIQSDDCTFAEDALSDFGKLVGLGENILIDGTFLPENAETLYFKKAKENKLTFNSAITKILGELLKPYGFTKIKGHTTFVKCVNGEFVHSISIRKEKTAGWIPAIDGNFPETHDMSRFEKPSTSMTSLDIPLYTEFNVYCDVFTIYDVNSLNIPFYASLSASDMFIRSRDESDTGNYMIRYDRFSYLKDSERSLVAEIAFVFEFIKKYMLPALDGVDNYDSFLLFLYKYHNANAADYIYLKAGNYHERLEKLFKQYEAETIYEYTYEYEKCSKRPPLEEEIASIRVFIDKKIKHLEELEADKERYDDMMNQLEKNKEQNVKVIIESGIKFGE